LEDIINNYVTKSRGGFTSKTNYPQKSVPVPYWCAEVEFYHPERWGFDVIIRDKLDWLTEDLKETKELQFSTQIGPVPEFKVVKIYQNGRKDKSHRWDGLVKQINGGHND
jgi:hypothetical protein